MVQGLLNEFRFPHGIIWEKEGHVSVAKGDAVSTSTPPAHTTSICPSDRMTA